MSKRRPKRRNPAGGRGPKKAQPGKLQADPTLVNLLSQALAHGPASAQVVPGIGIAMDGQLLPIALRIRDRCQELGGDTDAHIERALPLAMQFAHPAAGGVH